MDLQREAKKEGDKKKKKKKIKLRKNAIFGEFKIQGKNMVI